MFEFLSELISNIFMFGWSVWIIFFVLGGTLVFGILGYLSLFGDDDYKDSFLKKLPFVIKIILLPIFIIFMVSIPIAMLTEGLPYLYLACLLGIFSQGNIC